MPIKERFCISDNNIAQLVPPNTVAGAPNPRGVLNPSTPINHNIRLSTELVVILGCLQSQLPT